MSKEPVPTQEDQDLNEMLSWAEEWEMLGNRKDTLIKWLRARPQDAPILTKPIIEFLESSPKVKLTKGIIPLRQELIDEITRIFHTGEFDPFSGVHGTWHELSYKQKIYEIHKRFPNFSESNLGKIISENSEK
ncbi:MAG: hypothetical protein ACO20X_13920 [Alphaproteobacteria bacterium]